MGRHPVTEASLWRMLAEARAIRHEALGLPGRVVSTLMETLHDTPFTDGRRDDDQAANAAGRTAHARVRDYYLAKTATLAWIVGDTIDPPIQPILTEPGSGHDDVG